MCIKPVVTAGATPLYTCADAHSNRRNPDGRGALRISFVPGYTFKHTFERNIWNTLNNEP